MRITVVSARLEDVRRISNSREESTAFPASLDFSGIQNSALGGKYQSTKDKHLIFQLTPRYSKLSSLSVSL